MSSLFQKPEPGDRVLRHKGDVVEFTLTLSDARKGTTGKAWLRTNFGKTTISREEIINTIEQSIPRQHRDWHDLPMEQIDEWTFRVILPLFEIGRFEAKAFYVPSGTEDMLWPLGANTEVKVEPADYSGANIIYNAFVRQFGPNKNGDFPLNSHDKACLEQLDKNGFTVIPPSGTFRELIRQLDFIVDKLGCRIIQLLPIHPTPTVYGRMGRFGSPFASLDFLDVDPALAEFDRKTTPLQQFEELVNAVHRKHGKIFLDIAVNHTGWASKLQVEHPEWFVREDDESFYSPRAWGVIWEDLSKLDYSDRELWAYIADVFLTWCRRGVDGFRCDAGYKIPWRVWQYLVAKVRREFPETIFLLEGLGGKVSTTIELLTKANLDWAYSELFQNYDRSQIENYLPSSLHISAHAGILVNFAETHDNDRLASTSHAYARLRTALAALTSTRGAWGYANGVEWYAAEKIVVHEAFSLNWGNPVNQVEFVSHLAHIVSTHPAFHSEALTKMIQEGEGNSIAFFRHNSSANAKVLVLINLDHDKANLVSWQASATGMNSEDMTDLLSGRNITPSHHGDRCFLELGPGDVFCLTTQKSNRNLKIPITPPDPEKHHQNVFQRLKACALEIYCAHHDVEDFQDIDAHCLAQQLYADPREFCNTVNSEKDKNNIANWCWPWDSHRQVMVPPEFYLYFTAPYHFRVQIQSEDRVVFQGLSLPERGGRNFVLVPPQPVPAQHAHYTCRLVVFEKNHCVRTTIGHLLYLSVIEDAKAQRVFDRSTLLKHSLSILCTNGRGAMTMANAAWGQLESRYDALLSGNLNTNHPEDRWTMLTRCRIWMTYYGFSREVNLEYLDRLIQLDDAIMWQFTVPFGNGKVVSLDIRVEMVQNLNDVHIHFRRNGKMKTSLDSDLEDVITLIIKPDIEDRNFHTDTKAYTGPETGWPEAITPEEGGFRFSPAPGRTLRMKVSKGQFFIEREWQYMVHHPAEEKRGLEAYSDLYSPGYFRISLAEPDSAVLSAKIAAHSLREKQPTDKKLFKPGTIMSATEISKGVPAQSLSSHLLKAMKHFIVRREKHKTVIAGYPWFLDWGRDTLICARGMIAAGMQKEVRAILIQFAKFEDRGTLPNMIRGGDVGDRDTSDAPLWFITVCSDLVRAEDSKNFLSTDCGGRSLMQVICSIVNYYIAGTRNGIRMDRKSGLIYSPSHFTWMDTNFPAGTPRQGYPIEIQALWYAALSFASNMVESSEWEELANLVRSSIKSYFYNDDLGYLSDCLHANLDQPAESAKPDDHLRPNQLLAITLNAVQHPKIIRAVLNACERLLIPGAIRSLDNRKVRHQLPVYHHQNLLNDPNNPYAGRYEGDEDTRRKPAYHNGTAWTWLFPSYCEAWYKVYKDSGRKTALAMLGSVTQILNVGCIGQIPEILDGDYPHTLRGCCAQAWGATELYRVINLLDSVEASRSK